MAFRGDGKAVNIVAPTGGVVAGNFYYDEVTGWAGFALATEDAGVPVALEIERVHEFEAPSADAYEPGDLVYLDDDGTLSPTPAATARPIMRVDEVTDSVNANQKLVVAKMLPQTWAKFAVA